MPRPKNKKDLIDLSQSKFLDLFKLIESIPKEKQISKFIFEDRDKNIRDVLIHLYEWHMLLINWINSNKKGVYKSFLPSPYNWRTYPDMNVKIWEKHQDTDYEKSISMIKKSHSEVMKLIQSFSDNELFEKKYYDWLGNTNLASYCISSTSSHYDWAIKKLKKHINILKEK